MVAEETLVARPLVAPLVAEEPTMIVAPAEETLVARHTVAPLVAEAIARHCAHCGEDAPRYRCGRCASAHFCDASCARAGARAHQAACDALVCTRG